ncbi:hypothetical protein KDA_69330 [Dictyobacter alpinus]|uniref:Peptidase S53 domain-containing protein n=1 Tax=Dictyobacter alpinus TaxID=2014873 RepID=A0A402BJC6_9CHLR|nr:S53 family peptidase [Dictyobacter alpinus]GCE31449.1 hypothetical protein KDA_69330 [Dictyobacter alpinus]
MKNTQYQKWSLNFALTATVIILAFMTSGVVSRTTPSFATSKSASINHVIPGHVIPALNNAAPDSQTDPNNVLHLSIGLTLRDRDGLATLLERQNDPKSPYYQKYMTPQQFTARFSPTQSSVDMVTNYLRSKALTVNSVAPNRLFIDATGTVKQVEDTFAVIISNYTYNNRPVYAPRNEPSVPAVIAPLIQTIGGLSNLPIYPHHHVNKNVKPLIGPGGGFTPSELRTAYGVNQLISAGYSGSGQTVAIFELDGYKSSDVDTYLSNYNLGAGKYSNVLVDGATNTPGSGAIEVVLDMEVVSALAPNATQKIYIGPNSTMGVNDTYNKIVNDNLAKVTSISWGQCEQSSGNSELAALNNIFMQGAAQGQAFFAATGDSGAYDCTNGNSILAVDSPSGDPNIVGTGGTHLTTGSGGTYSNESAWGNSSDGSGGGGGVSTYFKRPSYQTGTNLTNANRMVPDISADADPASGYSIYCTASASNCSGWLSVGGTSASAPLWAGLATNINQYLIAQGKPVLGNAHIPLYNLYNNTQAYPPFHDVTTGNNLYYQAGPNYDLATGLGSPNAWNIAQDLAAGTGGTPTPIPTSTSTPSPTPPTTITPTRTPTPIPPTGTPSPGPGQLLTNGGFEQGNVGWTEYSKSGFEIVDGTYPYSGRLSAFLCGYNNCLDSISQTVTLPNDDSKIVLSYWLAIFTSERNNGRCYDNFAVTIRTSNGTIIRTVSSKCNRDARNWTQFSFDLTNTLANYRGQQVQLTFSATTNQYLPTSFFVDNVVLGNPTSA